MPEQIVRLKQQWCNDTLFIKQSDVLVDLSLHRHPCSRMKLMNVLPHQQHHAHKSLKKHVTRIVAQLYDRLWEQTVALPKQEWSIVSRFYRLRMFQFLVVERMYPQWMTVSVPVWQETIQSLVVAQPKPEAALHNWSNTRVQSETLRILYKDYIRTKICSLQYWYGQWIKYGMVGVQFEFESDEQDDEFSNDDDCFSFAPTKDINNITGAQFMIEVSEDMEIWMTFCDHSRHDHTKRQSYHCCHAPSVHVDMNVHLFSEVEYSSFSPSILQFGFQIDSDGRFLVMPDAYPDESLAITIKNGHVTSIEFEIGHVVDLDQLTHGPYQLYLLTMGLFDLPHISSPVVCLHPTSSLDHPKLVCFFPIETACVFDRESSMFLSEFTSWIDRNPSMVLQIQMNKHSTIIAKPHVPVHDVITSTVRDRILNRIVERLVQRNRDMMLNIVNALAGHTIEALNWLRATSERAENQIEIPLVFSKNSLPCTDPSVTGTYNRLQPGELIQCVQAAASRQPHTSRDCPISQLHVQWFGGISICASIYNLNKSYYTNQVHINSTSSAHSSSLNGSYSIRHPNGTTMLQFNFDEKGFDLLTADRIRFLAPNGDLYAYKIVYCASDDLVTKAVQDGIVITKLMSSADRPAIARLLIKKHTTIVPCGNYKIRMPTVFVDRIDVLNPCFFLPCDVCGRIATMETADAKVDETPMSHVKRYCESCAAKHTDEQLVIRDYLRYSTPAKYGFPPMYNAPCVYTVGQDMPRIPAFNINADPNCMHAGYYGMFNVECLLNYVFDNLPKHMQLWMDQNKAGSAAIAHTNSNEPSQNADEKSSMQPVSLRTIADKPVIVGSDPSRTQLKAASQPMRLLSRALESWKEWIDRPRDSTVTRTKLVKSDENTLLLAQAEHAEQKSDDDHKQTHAESTDMDGHFESIQLEEFLADTNHVSNSNLSEVVNNIANVLDSNRTHG